MSGAYRRDQVPPEDAATAAEFERRNGDIPTPDLLAGLRNGAWLDAQDFPPLRYHVPGIIPEGSTLLVGGPKIGKSWLVLAVGLAASAGGRALGAINVDARPVLYLALEDGHRRLQDRCRILLDSDRIPAEFEYLTTIQPMSILATIEAWLSRHPSAEPLVILDTLGKVMPPAVIGESSYGRDYRVGSALKRLVDERPGSALVVNHHDRKAISEDFVDAVSGTNGLAGAADTIVVLARQRNETAGLLKVTGRDVFEGEYAVSFTDAAWTLAGGNLAEAAAQATQQRATAGVGDRLAEVIDFVGTQLEGVSPAKTAATLGIDSKTASTYLSRAVAAGRLLRPSRGLYKAVGTVGTVGTGHPDSTHPTVPTPLRVVDTDGYEDRYPEEFDS